MRSPVSTIWTDILAAKGQDARAAAALGPLVARYRGLIRKYLGNRLVDFDQDNAEAELVHRVLKKLVDHAVPGAQRGRFRSLLRLAVNGFVVDTLRAETVRTGDGFARRVVTDDGELDAAAAVEAGAPGDSLDVEFALETLRNAVARLRREFAARGRSDREFDCLVNPPVDPVTGEKRPDEALAAELGVSVGALKVNRFRLRQALRVAFRQEVADSVAKEVFKEEVAVLEQILCQAHGRNPFAE